MADINVVIEQVREILIKEGQDTDKVVLFNKFINECQALSITEENFYKQVLKPASRSIDWTYIEEERKKKEITQKKLEAELAEQEIQIQNAPQYIDRLIKVAFEDDNVAAEELRKIFDKAAKFSLDVNTLAKKIDTLLDKKKFKSYPKADFDATSLKETLCSTNWYSESKYLKLTTPPPPPPEPFPWKILISALILVLAIGGLATYYFYLKPKWRDEAAPRYFTMANDATLRSSQIAGVDYNKVATLNYGSELITYDYGSEWCKVKTNGQEGFVSTKLVLDRKDFYLLNSIFGDIESKLTISTIKCRRALLDYFKSKNYIGVISSAMQIEAFGAELSNREVWQVFAKGPEIKPNTVIFRRNPGVKFTDFGVLIKNIKTGSRKFLLFSFADDETATLKLEQDAPPVGDILSIKPKKWGNENSFEIKYTTQ